MREVFSRWVCPTLCGCAIQWRTTWEDRDGDGVEDTVAFDGPIGILAQCDGHAGLVTADDLWTELRHYHGVAHRPDTCGCSLAYWWDDRIPQEERVHVPVAHPTRTKRCPAHRPLRDAAAHHDEVVRENREKNIAVLKVARALGWRAAVLSEDGATVVTPEEHPEAAPERIPWAHDQARAVRFDHAKLGRTAKEIADALAAPAE